MTARKLVRVEVDPQTCVGSQQCIGVDPDRFQLTADGWAHYVGPDIDAELAVQAADLCPVSAIRLTYEDTP
ncbi:MAG: hypothetical protein NVS2B17_31770 [Candidatus Velthaea sp.]